MIGRGRFVIARGLTGPKLECLGLLHNDPVDVYDCVTVFSKRVQYERWTSVNVCYEMRVKPTSEFAGQSSSSDRIVEFIVFTGDNNLTGEIYDISWDAEENAVVLFVEEDDWDVVLRVLSETSGLFIEHAAVFSILTFGMNCLNGILAQMIKSHTP